MSDQRVAIARLSKEARMLAKIKLDNIIAVPSDSSLFEWYFVIFNLKEEYEHGLYIGKIIFPPNYPFKPPDLEFITPNGRFETNKKICLTFTGYHPESWSNWSIEGMMIALTSFMLGNEQTTGSVSTSTYNKRKMALESLDYNLKNKNFRLLFSDHFTRLGITPESISLRQSLLSQQSQSFFISPSLVICMIVILVLLLLKVAFN